MKAVLIPNKRLVTSATRTTRSAPFAREERTILARASKSTTWRSGRPQAEEQQCLKKPDEGPEEKEGPSHPPREGAIGIWSPDQGDPAG